MMSESLTEMVQDGTDEQPVSFSENDLDLPEEAVSEEAASVDKETDPETSSVAPEEAPDRNDVESNVMITSLGDWFDRNGASFADEIKQVKLKVTGVDPKEDLVLTVPHETGELDENDQVKRRLVKIDNANVQPVLDLSGIDMKVYNNGGYRIINQYTDQIFMKCYGVKTGMVVTFCLLVDGILVPYERTKVSKKDDSLEIVLPDAVTITDTMTKPLDKEALVVLYKQAEKDIDEIDTIRGAVEYLTTKQDSIRDINHHVQIDDAIIRLFALSNSE
jgi:hypothetical protein